MRKIIIVFISILYFSFLGIAQQDPMYNQYMFNTLNVNPAYAGSAGITTFTGLYRHQWTGIVGAPRTHSYTGHGKIISLPIGVGGTIMRDTHGPVVNTSIYADAAYILNLDNNKLAFGLKGGVNLFTANLIDLSPVDTGDPVFGENIKNKVLPNFGFGMLYYSKTYYVGISIPKLLTNKLLSGELPDFKLNKERRHFTFIGGYVFDINSYVKFKPSLIWQVVNGAPSSYDITANFLFYETMWAGIHYRKQDAMGLLLQYEVNRKVKLGYSYDFVVSGLAPYNGGTHEVMLTVDLLKQIAGDKSPRYF